MTTQCKVKRGQARQRPDHFLPILLSDDFTNPKNISVRSDRELKPVEYIYVLMADFGGGSAPEQKGARGNHITTNTTYERWSEPIDFSRNTLMVISLRLPRLFSTQLTRLLHMTLLSHADIGIRLGRRRQHHNSLVRSIVSRANCHRRRGRLPKFRSR